MHTVNKGIEPQLFEEIIEKSFNSPFHKLLNFELMELGRGTAVVEMDAKENVQNALGIVHGGATASLCDTAMGIAVRSLGTIPTTVEMKVNYLLPGPMGKRLRAVGKVIKEGRTIIVAEGEIYCDERLIAKSIGTYFDLNRQ
ncbi:MAG: PaaI family thioesterase [Tepidanaerobacteraceae bacterium]|jgi:acyl-CoA thioesterase|nr:PaaI family thioesterase [Tepidanaerobacteraceae bacterium]